MTEGERDRLTASYLYPLPQALIAHQPADKRDQSRLMVVRREGQRVEQTAASQRHDNRGQGVGSIARADDLAPPIRRHSCGEHAVEADGQGRARADVHHGDTQLIDDFRARVNARLMLLPPHDPQFKRNKERVARDAERELIELTWDLGDDDAR